MFKNVEAQKKKRTPNYTTLDKSLLLNIIKEFKDIVESKKTNAVTWREKDEAWRRIAAKFNGNSTNGVYRDVSSLKKYYDNIKKNVRKQMADERLSLIKTGGGKAETCRDPNIDLALSIMNKKSIFGLYNEHDDDRKLTSENILEDKENKGEEVLENIILEYEDFDEQSLMASTSKSFAIHDISVTSENSMQEIIEDSDKSTTKTQEKIPDKQEKIKTGKSKTCSPWTSRNRPLITTPIYSGLSAKYTKLADLKIELVTCELEEKKERRKHQQVEFELRKKSLELDVKMKEVHLKKMMSPSNLSNFSV